MNFKNMNWGGFAATIFGAALFGLSTAAHSSTSPAVLSAGALAGAVTGAAGFLVPNGLSSSQQEADALAQVAANALLPTQISAKVDQVLQAVAAIPTTPIAPPTVNVHLPAPVAAVAPEAPIDIAPLTEEAPVEPAPPTAPTPDPAAVAALKAFAASNGLSALVNA